MYSVSHAESPASPVSSEDDAAYLSVEKSIEKSRKRNLSDDLLRGDLVADRLRAQEASASPVLKKQCPAPRAEMALTMQEFRDYMDNNTNKRLDGIDSSMTDMLKSVAKANKNIKANAAKLDEHQAAISTNQRSIAEMRDEMKKLKDYPALPPPREVPTSGSSALPPLLPVRDAEYDVARRSVRIWPVHGTSKEEVWNSAEFFFKRNLGLEGQVLESMIEKIDRVSIPSGPSAKLEVLVTFSSFVTRDKVMGSAAKLATFVDKDNKPTAGLRLEVPSRLQPVFRTLFKFGQALRTRHGAGLKRHVKFDDASLSLIMNVKLPGDDHWSPVSYEMAKRNLRSRQVIDEEGLERRLDIGGGMLGSNRPRAASTGGASQSMEVDPWTGRGSGPRATRRTESVNLD